MKRVRLLLLCLLVISQPLSGFAATASMPHCDMQMGTASMDEPTTGVTPAAQADCCDCADSAPCKAPCATGAAFVGSVFAAAPLHERSPDRFARLSLTVSPTPPDRLLRPPITL